MVLVLIEARLVTKRLVWKGLALIIENGRIDGIIDTYGNEDSYANVTVNGGVFTGTVFLISYDYSNIYINGVKVADGYEVNNSKANRELDIDGGSGRVSVELYRK